MLSTGKRTGGDRPTDMSYGISIEIKPAYMIYMEKNFSFSEMMQS
jgi:hypothetical protein